MTKIIALSLLLVIACHTGAKAQGISTLDSLQNLLKGADQNDSINYLMHIGEEYFTSEHYAKALDYFFPSLKLSEATSEIKHMADASNSIGRVYYDMENYKQSLVYFNRALKHYKKNDDDRGEGGVLNNLALIYYEVDSIDLAIDNYQRALKIKEKYDDKLDIAAIQHNLGLVYIDQKNYLKAIENLVSSRSIFLELGNAKHAANTTNNIGRAYYKSGQYQEALQYFERGLAESTTLNSSFLMMDNYRYQADCYAKMYRYKEAYSFSNMHHAMQDSLLNIEKKKEIAEIQAKYENEIEEQENKLLKKENEANAFTIKIQYIIGIGIFVITILAIVLAAIYYRSNEAKKKANELLTNQKVEIQQKNDVLSSLNKEITKQNKEIKIQKKELEELNGIKDKLFSIMSHEFRSPLNSLKGTLALLKIGALSDDEFNDLSKQVTDKINTTSIFLDNLLNWAKSQMQGISAKPVDIEVREMVEENILLLNPMADEKKIRLKNKIPEKSKAYIDPNMLNLIFKNLISNAIKYSLKGGVVEINLERNTKMNTISVKDKGIGMSEGNMKMLFQLQSFTMRGTANESGTGLGLYITKNFIESNGGKIWVESEEGAGTTFKFTVPI